MFENDSIKFESLFPPRLEGELSDLLHDDELLNRFVLVVGNVQIQERGNCFLSFHIVESMVHHASGFDDYALFLVKIPDRSNQQLTHVLQQ